MNRKRITPDNHEHWLQLRSEDLTSTAVAALFGLSPYLTNFELWHQVKHGVESSFQENERTIWGNRLEPAIAKGIAEDHSWNVQPFKDYWRIPELKIGSSFDYAIGDISQGIVTDEFTPTALLEIKNVDGLQFRDKWIIEDGQVIEAPPHIELQAQHQMLVSGLGECYIGALVGGNNVSIIKRRSEANIQNAILHKAEQFWQSIEKNIEPAPDFEADAKFISSLYGYAKPGSLLEADESLVEACLRYSEAGAQEKKFAKAKAGAKAEILTIMKDAEKVIGDVKVTTWMVAEAEMAFTKKAFRGFRVTIPKPKKEKK